MVPIAWQNVVQDIPNQVWTRELLKENTVERHLIIAAEFGDN